MKFAEFKEEIKKVYAEVLPESLVVVQAMGGHYGTSIFVDCYLAKNKSEESYGYFENDVFKIGFSNYIPGKFDVENEELPEDFKLKKENSCYLVKPENSYCAFGSRKISKRITGNTPGKIVKSFEKYIVAVKESLKEDLAAGNICDEHVEIVKRKLA